MIPQIMKDERNPKNAILPITATIRQAVESLNQPGTFQVVFTVDSANRVVGCVTDGDIRRAFLRGCQLDSSLEKIARKSFTSSNKSATPAEILTLMKKNGVRQVPILDDDGRLLDIRILDEFVSEQFVTDYPVVIMAGGKGSRLYPHTKETPKPLLKVGERPIIEQLVMNFQAKGVREFYVTVNHFADQIVSFLGDGSRYGCEIKYVRETTPLGTAGSLSLLKEQISKDFLVINGDVLSTVDFKLLTQFHRENGAVATACGKVLTLSIPFGVLSVQGPDLKGIEEKPDFSFTVNSGIYVFAPEVFGFIEENQFLDMPSLLERLIAAGKAVKCFQSIEPWIDIGSHEDFERAHKYFQYLTR